MEVYGKKSAIMDEIKDEVAIGLISGAKNEW
jgi:hypothetical protein